MMKSRRFKIVPVFVVLCLVAATARSGTFELADPAAEILKEQQSPDYAQPESDTEVVVVEWTGNGVGETVCGKHTAYKQVTPGRYQSNLYWLQGFIDGVAYQRFVTLGDNRLNPVYDPDSMEAWIENYCIENPPETLDQAARAFLSNLTE